MDPVAVSLIVTIIKATPKTVEALVEKKALHEIRAILNRVLAKQDEHILSTIKSAFEAIGDALTTENLTTRSQRLSYAETALLPHTNLDLRLDTAGRPNASWIAVANYGLSLICGLRNDDAIQAKHLLRMFEVAPRLAREKLAPELYEEFFLDKCQDVCQWKKNKEKEINQSQYLKEVALDHAKAAAVVTGSFVGFLFLSAWNRVAAYGLGRGGIEKGTEIWNNASAEKYRKEALYKLEDQVQCKIDESCRRIACLLLDGAMTERADD